MSKQKGTVKPERWIAGRRAQKMASFFAKNFQGSISERGEYMADKKEIEDIADITVSAKVIGEICGIGDRMVRRYADEGVFKRSAHGRYKLFQSVKNYITAVKVAKVGENVKSDLYEDNLDLNNEKAIHEHLKSMITEIKLQLIKGQVHKSEDVERVITDMLVRFRSKMQALPAKLATKLEQKNRGEIQKILQTEIIDALTELSEYNPADYYSDEHIDVENDELFAIINEEDEHE